MEPGYGSIAYTSRQLQQLLQKALEQVFPNCKIKQIPIGTSFLNGQGVFSSGLAFCLRRVKGISPAEAADRLSVFCQEKIFFFQDREKQRLSEFSPIPGGIPKAPLFFCGALLFSWHFTEEDFGFSVLLLPPWLNCKIFCPVVQHFTKLPSRRMLSLPCPDCALALLDKPQELALIFSLARLADAKAKVFCLSCWKQHGLFFFMTADESDPHSLILPRHGQRCV